jgi:hypothetical protein
MEGIHLSHPRSSLFPESGNQLGVRINTPLFSSQLALVRLLREYTVMAACV